MKLSLCWENYHLSGSDVKVAGHFVEGEGAVHTTRVILVVRGNPPVQNRVKIFKKASVTRLDRTGLNR
jgi:hypothetical protein